MIEDEPMPESVADLIFEHHEELQEGGIPDLAVSVRSAGLKAVPACSKPISISRERRSGKHAESGPALYGEGDRLPDV
jgi:hypothetical protein